LDAIAFNEHLAKVYEKLENLLRGAVTFAAENPCGVCNSCCTYPIRLQVSALEIEYVYGVETNCSKQVFLNFVNNRPSPESPGGGTCPHYDLPSHRCAIYHRRPMCCRIFGYVPFRTLNEGCAFKDALRRDLRWSLIQSILSEFSELRVAYYRANHGFFKPASIMDLLLLGNVLLEKGDTEGAFRFYDRALEIDSSSALALSYQAKKNELEGRLDEAARAYEKAILCDPEEPTLLIKLGYVLHGLGRPEEAIGHYRKALARDDENFMAYSNMGLAYLALGEKERAFEAYDKASCYAPDWSTAYIMKGNILDMLERNEEALSAYEEALKIDCKDPLVHLCLGKIYRKIGEADKALASFRNFLRLSDNEEACRLIEREIHALEKKQ
jgi:tetratricopeptide (TPR) repeat protein